jgi:hypothetical protein
MPFQASNANRGLLVQRSRALRLRLVRGRGFGQLWVFDPAAEITSIVPWLPVTQ